MVNINLIVALTRTKDGKLGIGNKGSLPWYLPEDLKYFKELTTNKAVVMGNNTFKSIGKVLPDRINYILSYTKGKTSNHDNVIYFDNVIELFFTLTKYHENEEVFVIGGSKIYEHFISCAKYLYITEVFGNFDVDTYFPDKYLDKFIVNEYSTILTSTNGIKYKYIKYINSNISQENQYINLLENVLKNGSEREDRTKVGTLSLFSPPLLDFDISKSIPLMTIKNVPWKMAIEELLWMLRGETDSKILENKGVNIWKGNTSRKFLDDKGLSHFKEGETGELYGWNLRRFGAEFPDTSGGFDQLSNVENLLKTDPFSRRIIWNLYNPNSINKSVLLPCHIQCQFYVKMKDNEKFLSCKLYMRSNDLVLGAPFNYFAYSVLTYILAIRCGMKPDRLIVSIGDAHIYKNHIEKLKEILLHKNPRMRPYLEVNEEIKDKKYEEITIEDFNVVGYLPNCNVKFDMAV